MIDRMIVDADVCIKLGGSEKYRFLYDVLPLIARTIYIHTHALGEVRYPVSAVQQLQELIRDKIVLVVNEQDLSADDRKSFDNAYQKLGQRMINPMMPNKNKGEVCSLAYAKAVGIPVFATDEMDLQRIVDSQLNTGQNDITCLRIVDIVLKARYGEFDLPRKVCKALWVIAGKRKELFDQEIWPKSTTR